MNVYEVITQRVMEKLERGTIPWQQPWKNTDGMLSTQLRQRASTGVSVWVLSSAGYSSPYWLTYCQAQEIGGHVKKGEHGPPVVFWKFLERGEENQDGEAPDSQTRRVPLARLYTVFNVQQCDL